MDNHEFKNSEKVARAIADMYKALHELETIPALEPAARAAMRAFEQELAKAANDSPFADGGEFTQQKGKES